MSTEEVTTISSVSRDIILNQVIGLPEGENFILILDDATMSLVNSVCGQFALFDRGCILLEHIQSKRDYIPGVCAIYFVEPTNQNVTTILEDFKEIKSFVEAEGCFDRIIYCGMEDSSGESALYDKIALRFKGDLTEDLATRIVNNAVLQKRLTSTRLIHMNYHVEEPNLAISNIPTALTEIWGKSRNHAVLDQIAYSLVDICVNLGVKPRVHYEQGYPCAEIADLFEQYIEQYIANFQPNLREKGQLLLVNRTIDPLIPLLHPITYEPMVMDLLPVGEGGEFEYHPDNGESRNVLLNSHDKVWEAYKYEHILTTKSLLTNAAKKFMDATQESKNTIRDIGNLIKTLPENKQRKSLFVLHINITDMCIKQFRERMLNKLIPLEQTIVTGCDEAGSVVSSDKILIELKTLLQSDLSLQDKRRLIMTYAIARGMDDMTKQSLFQAGGLGPEDYPLIDNLSMLGVPMGRPFQQRFDTKEYSRQAKQQSKQSELMVTRYESQIRYLLNDLVTNALPTSKFDLYDTGDNNRPGIIGIDISRSVRGNMRSARAMRMKNEQDEGELEWYGKREKKVIPTTGEPLICYIVGGTCYAEIQSLNEMASLIGRNVTIASTNIFKQNSFVDSLRNLDLSTLLWIVC